MSTLGPFLISILLTTVSVMAFPLAILPIFAEVKPIEKKQLSSREMKLAIALLGLYILGFVNLYAIWNIGNKNPGEPDGGDPIVDSQGPAGQDGEDAPQQDNDDENADLSPEELLVKQNWDEIQQLKAEYSQGDTEVLGSDSGSVEFNLYEKAGYVFENLMETGDRDILLGEEISFAKLVIMDYSSDTVICTLNSGEIGFVRYSPGNQKKFYIVVLHDDYNIHVTPPFQVVSEGQRRWTNIFLEKKDSQYTSLFQLRLYMESPNLLERYSIVPPGYDIIFYTKNIYDNQNGGTPYQSSTSESGILYWDNKSYFCLNTDYIMDISLQFLSGTFQVESTHRTFDGSVTNSNQIDLYFNFNQEDSDT